MKELKKNLKINIQPERFFFSLVFNSILSVNKHYLVHQKQETVKFPMSCALNKLKENNCLTLQ